MIQRSRLLKFGLPLLAFCLLVPLLYSRWVTRPTSHDEEDIQVAMVDFFIEQNGKRLERKGYALNSIGGDYRVNVRLLNHKLEDKYKEVGDKASPSLLARLNRKYPFATFYSCLTKSNNESYFEFETDCINLPKPPYIGRYGFSDTIGVAYYTSLPFGGWNVFVTRFPWGWPDRNWHVKDNPDKPIPNIYLTES